MTADRDIVRDLAADLAEIGARPEQEEKIEGWKRCNGLKPHRPMLWITEIPWGEFEDDVDERELRVPRRNDDKHGHTPATAGEGPAPPALQRAPPAV